MNAISAVAVHPTSACTSTRTHTQFPPPPRPGGMLYERVVLCSPKSSVHIFKRGAVWLPPPPFHNIMCFLFCVCFDPSLAANLCCGEAQARVALLCYFWQQQRLVAAEGERRQKGDIMKLETRGCLRDFCLEELFFNHQSLSVCECVCVRPYRWSANLYSFIL